MCAAGSPGAQGRARQGRATAQQTTSSAGLVPGLEFDKTTAWIDQVGELGGLVLQQALPQLLYHSKKLH